MEEVVAELRRRMRREKFEIWFRGFQLVRLAADEVEFSVPNGFIRDWINRHYLHVIEEAVAAVWNAAQAAAEQGATDQALADRAVADRADADDAANAALDPQHRPRIRLSFARPQEPPTPKLLPASPSPTVDGADPATPLASAPGDEHCARGTDAQSRPASDVPVSDDPHAAPTDRDPSRNGNVEGDIDGNVEPKAPIPTPTSAPRSFHVHANSNSSSNAHVPGGSLYPPCSVNRDYTFENFVVGSCNRLAQASAMTVGENPGNSYNPLFIHGNVGLGKTHLLQAICHAVLRKRPEARVVYLSCEEFTNRFIQSIERKCVDEFRAFHRSADVLVVDDVDFLASKAKTQEEFFHTFNELFHAKRQVVLSSDRPPLEIPTLEDRLVSRFKWGLVTDIDMPCFETRVAIVKRKARMRSVDLPDDIAYLIAQRVTTNIRELEGALTKVLGVAAITEQDLSVALAEDALRGISTPRPPRARLEDIMTLITSEFSLSSRDLTGKSRSQAISFPRQIGMYLARELTDHSLEDIGRFFGGRDHTTVIYAVDRIRKRFATDRVVKDLLATLTQRLSGGRG